MSDVTVSNLAQRYESMLKDEGFKILESAFDEDGDYQIVVKVDGVSYVMVFDHDDPKFIRVVLPNFYTVEKDDQLKAVVAVNYVAKTCKGAKVHLTSANDDTMAVAEFLDNGESVDQSMLSRYFSMVRNAAQQFGKQMQA